VAAIGHASVVATLHVYHHCCGAMPFSQVGTHAAGVIVIESKAMYPTVIHVESIIGYDGTCSCRDTGECSGHGCGRWCWGVIGRSLNVCCIGTMKACLACGELAQAFFVFSGEDASCFKHEEGKVFDGNVSQGIAASGRDTLDFVEAFPQGFDGIVGSPNHCNAGIIDLQFSMGDGTIVGA